MPKIKLNKTKSNKKSDKIICEECGVNVVSNERFKLIGRAICGECSDKGQLEIMAVNDCDKDGVSEFNLVDAKTFHAYSSTTKSLSD
jgi:hypothetical protein